MRTDQLSKLLGRPVELAPLPVTGRYADAVVKWEVRKGIIGAVVCVGLVAALQPSAWISVPLLIVTALFGLYAWQQSQRRPLRFMVDDHGVTRIRGGKHTPVRWGDLVDFRLNYYPNGKHAKQGTLVVILRTAQERLRIDSGLDTFPTLLERCAQAVRQRRMELHPTTEDNLQKLGL